MTAPFEGDTGLHAGDRLLDAGVTLADLDANPRCRHCGSYGHASGRCPLPKLVASEATTPRPSRPLIDPKIEEIELRARTADALLFQRANREARRLLAAEEAALTPRPSPVSLEQLLEEPDSPTHYRVEGLWPAEGRVILSAPMKSGKTTLVGNLVRSLVDGDRFLDVFEVEQATRVVVIDDEMSREQIKRWLREQGIQNADAVTVVPLRGLVASFNILDPTCRAEWAVTLAGADVVVLDCLRPVLDALGPSEDKDAGKFLVAFDALLKEASVGEALVIHHTGHGGERSRGDSRLRDWPDAEWNLDRDTADPAAPRFFRAFGRDVDVPQGRLAYDHPRRHLAFHPGEGKLQAAAKKLVDNVVLFVAKNPGCSGAAIEKGLPGDTNSIRAAVVAAEREKRIRVDRQVSEKSGRTTRARYYLIET